MVLLATCLLLLFLFFLWRVGTHYLWVGALLASAVYLLVPLSVAVDGGWVDGRG